MKKLEIIINGMRIKTWKNGEYGAIGMYNGNVVFKPYDYDEEENEVYEYIDDEHPIVTLATGFTAYQYSHPDGVDNIQNYYNQCKEAYKASLRYKAMFYENDFMTKHLQEEAESYEASKKLYDYEDLEELKSLTSAYPYNLEGVSAIAIRWIERNNYFDTACEDDE